MQLVYISILFIQVATYALYVLSIIVVFSPVLLHFTDPPFRSPFTPGETPNHEK